MSKEIDFKTAIAQARNDKGTLSGVRIEAHGSKWIEED